MDITTLHERVTLDCPSMLRIVLDSPAWADLLHHTLATDHVVLVHTDPSPEGLFLPPPLVAQGYTSALFCPIHLAPEGLGLLACLATATRLWDDDSIGLVQTVVELLALALHTQQRFQASQQTVTQHAQRATQLGIQRAIAQVILSQLELPAILEALSDQLQAGLGYTYGHPAIADLVCLAVHLFGVAAAAGLRQWSQSRLAAWRCCIHPHRP